MKTIAKPHFKQREAPAASSVRKLVLVGNPNVGKSVIFNALTGQNVDVSNYPGTTIDISHGMLGKDKLSDTPGIYGVSSFNDEERIARSMLLEADIIINVLSALSLDRDLFLSLQLIEIGKPMVIVINQMDEAKGRGINIDTESFSRALGVPVVSCVATQKKGIADVVSAIAKASCGIANPEIEALYRPYLDQGVDKSLALLVAEGDEASITASGITLAKHSRDVIYQKRRLEVNRLCANFVKTDGRKKSLSTKLGHFLLHPFWGSIIAIAVCYLVFYEFLGVLIAGDLVQITEKTLMNGYYEPFVHSIGAKLFPCVIVASDTAVGGVPNTAQAVYNFYPYPSLPTFAGNLLFGEYGVFTLSVTYLLGLLFPLVLGFYLGLSIMEDSGYLPRLAVTVDRVMNKFGLNGRAIIPLILGLGCVTMATITTRLLSTKREKLIATALLGIAIPCSAQLGVVSGVLAKCGGFMAWSVYGFLTVAILAVAGVMLNQIVPGKSDALFIDLPPMRLPRISNVLRKTWTKSVSFLQESFPMFVLAGVVVTLAQVTGLLDWFIALLRPLTVNWLLLPDDPRIATTFILGIVRRDFAAFGLTDVGLTAAQAVTAMMVITLFVPCIATVGVMIKERGIKVAMTIWLSSWVLAFAVGGGLARILPLLMG